MSREQNRKPNYKCVVCNKDMYVRPSAIKKSKGWGFTCSKGCGKVNRSKHTTGINNHQFGIKGIKNASFTGERKISNYGYVLIYKPEHKRANHAGYVFEHILIMENFLNRPLKHYGFNNKNNEVCHHIDRNKKNNDISNLELMTDSEHTKLHIKEDRGRALKAGNSQKRFNSETVEKIRDEYKKGDITQMDLAVKYKCSQSVIGSVINRKRYCYGK